MSAARRRVTPGGESAQYVGVQTIVSRWGEHGDRPEPASLNDDLFASFIASVSMDVECAPIEAWELIATVGRMGEFSPECIGAEWIDGASGPFVGARFEGTNHLITTYRGDDIDFTWIRVCTVTAAEPPSRFGYVVGDRYDGTPACTWEFQIVPIRQGSRVTQRFQHLPRGLSGTRLGADAFPADAESMVRDRQRSLINDMAETLQRIKQVLESAAQLDAP